MDWQLPDIGKMIMNNILPSNLSAYTVIGTAISFCRSAVVGYYFRIVLFPLIRIGLYIVVVLEIIKPISEYR